MATVTTTTAQVPTLANTPANIVDKTLRAVQLKYATVIANQALAEGLDTSGKTVMNMSAVTQAVEVLAALDLVLPIIQASR